MSGQVDEPGLRVGGGEGGKGRGEKPRDGWQEMEVSPDSASDDIGSGKSEMVSAEGSANDSQEIGAQASTGEQSRAALGVDSEMEETGSKTDGAWWALS